MEKKQTAVEWLEEQLEQALLRYGQISVKYLKIHTERAKQMEKEQIVEAYCKAGLDIAHNDSIKESGLAQEYYNETYGGQDGSNH